MFPSRTGAISNRAARFISTRRCVTPPFCTTKPSSQPQKLHKYIYYGSGAQVHVLCSNQRGGSIVSLPHHLLLATVLPSEVLHSHIVYTDITTKELAGHLDYSYRTLGLSAGHAGAYNHENDVLQISITPALWPCGHPRCSACSRACFCKLVVQHLLRSFPLLIPCCPSAPMQM